MPRSSNADAAASQERKRTVPLRVNGEYGHRNTWALEKPDRKFTRFEKIKDFWRANRIGLPMKFEYDIGKDCKKPE